MLFETEYIGKSDITTHFCRCDACHRLTMLSTYSTTRFAKLVNIPLLPIGKFRMVDECPQCGNRGVTSARKYAKERQRNLDLMMEGFASEPDNPQNCAHALHTLMVYDMESWFHDVRKSYGLRFETNMQIQHLIAQGLSRFSEYQEAMNYCRKAIVLGAGKQAEELLAYCQSLLEASEGTKDLDALKVQPESPLRAYTPLITLTATAAIVMITMAVSSLQNYKAWIVNGSLQKYGFALDDQTYELEPGDAKQIKLRLGEHELKMEDSPPQSFRYSIPLIKQLLEKHLLVINPDNMALLAIAASSDHNKNNQTTYSSSGRIRLFTGISEPQHGLHKISPKAKRIPSISLYRPESHMAMVKLMLRLEQEDSATAYARHALRMNPALKESAELLQVAFKGADDSEILAFLRKGMDAAPSLLPWHLYYQNYMTINHPRHDLEHEYTLRCNSNPDDATNYYLLARVVRDRQSAYRLYEHADKNNAMGGLGLYAIAHDHYIRGQFKEALPFSTQAMQRSPQNGAFRELNENILLALRDYDSLLSDTLKTRIQSQSRSLADRTVLYLTCAGYHKEAATEISRIGEKWPEDLLHLNAIRFYAVGNISDYLECMADMGNPHTALEEFLHRDQIADADALISQKRDHPYWEHLVLYCAAMSQNKLQIAERNMEKAIREVDAGRSSYNRIVKMLSGEETTTLEAIRNLDISAQEKALLCVALSYRFPDLEQPFDDLALSYNFTPAYPQLLLKKWIRQSAAKAVSTENSTHTIALGM